MTTIDENPVDKKSPNKTTNIPDKDADFSIIAKYVSDSWHNKPQITLVYILQTEFALLVGRYGSVLGARLSTGGDRPEFTNKLDNLDVDIDKGISAIKVYLSFKYGRKDAPSYYAKFAIVKKNRKYILPKDRNIRMESFDRILAAIVEQEFEDFDYGTDFWTNIKNNYDTDLGKAMNIDGSVSSKVGDKNVLKKEIRRVLNSLIKVIKGNYPETYKAELRSWGFQKEKY